jgi:hypothetical protein
MRGPIPPLPNTSSWGGAQLKKRHRDFTFPYLMFIAPRDAMSHKKKEQQHSKKQNPFT